MSDPDTLDRCMACMKLRAGAAVCPHCGFDEAQADESSRHLPLRTVLAERYLVGRVLGEGGFGITYAAWDRTLQNRRAIKEYFPDDAAHRGPEGVTVTARSRGTRALYQEGLERFLTEARTLEKFQDEPGIVQVRDFFPANGTGYLVMAFLEGRTVKALLEEHGGRFDFAVALPLLLPVMEALQKVHDTGLLHRDISPDNLMITLNRQVRLLDFGAAKSLVTERSRSMASVFKKGYTPYEQYLEDAPLGPATDVYALAATMYRMLTGVVPPSALERRVADGLVPPQALGVSIPPAAEAVLLKALAVEPGDRWASVQGFRLALVEASVAASPVPPPAPRPPPAPPTPPPGPVPPPPAPAPVDPRWVMFGLPAAVVGGLGLMAWLGGSKAPQVTAIEFPDQITVGRSSTLKVRFEDADADLERVEFSSREGSWRIPSQDLRERFAGRTEGSVEIPMTASKAAKARIEVVVIDRQQNRSAVREFAFESVEPPSSPPVLVRVQAPPTAVAGQPFQTRAYFEDVDGDVRRMTVRILNGTGHYPPVELSGLQRQGQVDYRITMNGPGTYRYSYQFEDARGKLSNVATVEVEVQAPYQRPPAPPAYAPPPPAPPPYRPERPPASRLLEELLRNSGLKR